MAYKILVIHPNIKRGEEILKFFKNTGIECQWHQYLNPWIIDRNNLPNHIMVYSPDDFWETIEDEEIAAIIQDNNIQVFASFLSDKPISNEPQDVLERCLLSPIQSPLFIAEVVSYMEKRIA